MSTEEINESSADGTGESTEINSTSAPLASAEPAPEAAEATSKWSLNRRKFLTAAALGTAAATFLNKGSRGVLHLGPASAMANVVTNVNCTANDVRIIGPGIVVNEPCSCSGTFGAVIRFKLNNNTGTQRYCVTVHLCDGRNAAGQVVVPAQDLIVGTVDPGEKFYEVTIPNYPCGAGNVCFGEAGSGEDGGFAKGETCPTGKCCTVISWNVRANDPCPQPHEEIIKSKCRAQQICIQGFGISATCADGACATRSLSNGCCNVACGASLNVKITAAGGTGAACSTPLTISVKRPGASGFTNVTLNGSGCYVDSSPVQGTYTFRATDCHGCSRDTTLAVCVQTLATPTVSAGAANCSGSVTLTASPCTAGLTYTFREGNTVLGTGNASCQLTTTFSPGDHSVTVTVSNGTAACDITSQPITVHINQPVTVALAAPQSGCNGVVTLTATASGGAGGYTFQFSGASGTANGNTITLQPQLNGACRTVTVTATDSAGCSSNSASRSFSQCVTTSTCTP